MENLAYHNDVVRAIKPCHSSGDSRSFATTGKLDGMNRRLSFIVAFVMAGIPCAIAGCESDSTSSSPNIDASSLAFDAGTADNATSTPDGGPGSSPDAGPTGDPNALCQKYGPPTLLTHKGTPHLQTNNPNPVDSAPKPQGGTIVDGIYDEISNTNWGNGSGTSGSNDLSLIVFEGGAWFYRYQFDGIDDGTYSAGTYTVDPTTKQIFFSKSACGGGGVPGSPDDKDLTYTATVDTFATIRDQRVGPSQTRVVKERLFKKR